MPFDCTLELGDLVLNPALYAVFKLNGLGTVAKLLVSVFPASKMGIKISWMSWYICMTISKLSSLPLFMSYAMFLSLEYQAYITCLIYTGLSHVT